jgi:hypothetical protein
VFQAGNLARLRNGHDAHAVRTWVALDALGKPLELRIPEVDSDVVDETVWMQLDGALRKWIVRANGAVGELLALLAEPGIEPARFADEDPIDADGVHCLNARGKDRVQRRGAPVERELIEVDLRVDDLDVPGHFARKSTPQRCEEVVLKGLLRRCTRLTCVPRSAPADVCRRNVEVQTIVL